MDRRMTTRNSERVFCPLSPFVKTLMAASDDMLLVSGFEDRYNFLESSMAAMQRRGYLSDLEMLGTVMSLWSSHGSGPTIGDSDIQ